MSHAPDPRPRVGRLPSCPKCQGQYWRVAYACQCYLCCFSWDLRDPMDEVLARARRTRPWRPSPL